MHHPFVASSPQLAVLILESIIVTVDLPEDVLARLQAEAKRRGVSIDLVIAELTATLPAEPVSAKQTLPFIGLGSSNSGRFCP